MKISLVNPPWETPKKLGFRSNVRWPFMISRREFAMQRYALYHFPLYQAYAAAMLREHNIMPVVVDALADSLNTQALIQRLIEEQPDLVVVEISTPSFYHDLDTIARLRKQMDVPIAVIGSHASVFHQEILRKYDAIDLVIRGEYEESLVELALAMRDEKSLAGIAGITFRDTQSGRVVVNASRTPIENLDALPFPARELFPWQRYHEPVYESLPWITMVTSRGCPFGCVFCSWPQTLYGRKYRVRSVENVLQEMEWVIDRFSPGEIFFDDDTFTVDRKRVKKLCLGIVERGIEVVWSCMGRLDTVDRETLEAMAQAGCRRIKFGIETGSPAIMRNIDKRLDLTKVPQTLKLAREVGIKVHGTFMIGLPGDTPQTVRETIELACSLNLDSAQFSIATPFPGTAFYAQAEAEGWLVTHDWSKFDGAGGSVVSYPQLPKEEIDSLLSYAWTKLYWSKGDYRELVRKTIHKVKDQGLWATVNQMREFLASLNRIERKM